MQFCAFNHNDKRTFIWKFYQLQRAEYTAATHLFCQLAKMYLFETIRKEHSVKCCKSDCVYYYRNEVLGYVINVEMLDVDATQLTTMNKTVTDALQQQYKFIEGMTKTQFKQLKQSFQGKPPEGVQKLKLEEFQRVFQVKEMEKLSIQVQSESQVKMQALK